MALVFKQLKNGDQIGRCTQLLANRMQCVKAASWEISDPENKDLKPYQTCNMHKKLAEAGIGVAPVVSIPNTGTVATQMPTDKQLKSLEIKQKEIEQKKTETEQKKAEAEPKKEPEVKNDNTESTTTTIAK